MQEQSSNENGRAPQPEPKPSAIKELVSRGFAQVREHFEQGSHRVGASLGTLRAKSFDEIVADVRSLSAKHPGKLLIGSFVLGYVVGLVTRVRSRQKEKA